MLERLAGYASFSASAELIRSLRPLTKLDLVQGLQACTSEARKLLSTNAEVSVGGTTDIRPMVELARRGGVLDPSDLLAIKTSLQVGRELGRMFEKTPCSTRAWHSSLPGSTLPQASSKPSHAVSPTGRMCWTTPAKSCSPSGASCA